MHEPTGDFERLALALRDQWQVEDVEADLAILRRLQPALRKGEWKVTVALHRATTTRRPRILDIWPGYHEGGLYGLAIDLGSTTIAAHLCDLRDGRGAGLLRRDEPADPLRRRPDEPRQLRDDEPRRRCGDDGGGARGDQHAGRRRLRTRRGSTTDAIYEIGLRLQPGDAPSAAGDRPGGTGPGALCAGHQRQPEPRCARSGPEPREPRRRASMCCPASRGMWGRMRRRGAVGRTEQVQGHGADRRCRHQCRDPAGQHHPRARLFLAHRPGLRRRADQFAASAPPPAPSSGWRSTPSPRSRASG